MKHFKQKIVSLLIIIAAILTTSCELAEVTDIEPVFLISENNAITNLSQAQTVLDGTYGVLINGEAFITDLPALTSMMGLSMKPGVYGNKFEKQFFQNSVSSENYRLDAIYLKLYLLINNANHVITKTDKIEIDNPRKHEIIAEAKILRGLAHFYLLRLWGEFYDINSNNGIVLQLEPVTDVVPKPRSTVLEVYNSIIEDLDYGIQYGPNFGNALYTSNLLAKALKSKVLLYKKDYSLAAKLALEVINSNERTLEIEFGDIFTKKTTNPNEALFLTPFDNQNDANNKTFFNMFIYTISDYYVTKLNDDTRKSAAISTNPYFGTPRNNKFVDPTNPQGPDTEYVLRLGEVYLIYAEAVLRGDNDISEALDALNEIRDRVDKTPLVILDKQTLLNEIRHEKFLELGAESGEDWFDLVRYYKEGTININDYKTITSDNKLILPFPYKTVLVSNDVLKQNAGY
ncbi:RagB/SusD family nutrient uptake outer membrane protein [Flavobacteriaceae bacterium F08102]|nr:RagB/SusD family nutrient uptake outer membrane protein [Flavobacteriaceae bacterium F08102]